MRPLPVAPRQMPFYAGATYFELDRNSPHWQQMQTSGGFAIHVSGDFPNLQHGTLGDPRLTPQV